MILVFNGGAKSIITKCIKKTNEKLHNKFWKNLKRNGFF